MIQITLQSLRQIYSLRNITFHIILCLLTYIIVTTGFDTEYYGYMHGSTLSKYLQPAVIVGGLVPLVGLPILFIGIYLFKKTHWKKVAATLLVSAFLAWSISSLYKSFTGRVEPKRAEASALHDASYDWNFGFMEHGIFNGWPSSHTTVAFAMSFSLITLFPRRKTVTLCALFYAIYIGIGVTVGIHWFSEFVAGAILGTLIGCSVGEVCLKSYKQ